MSRIAGKISGFGNLDQKFRDDTERAQTLYFNWLCILVRADNYCNKSWYILAKLLHNIEYYWTIPNDDNRAKDGVRLREIWLSTMKNEAEDLGVLVDIPKDALNGPCTMLEMMIALASRIESDIMQKDEYGNRTWWWFWYMIDNLIDQNVYFSDDVIMNESGDLVKYKVIRCLDRNYDFNGIGGLFPLTYSDTDQRYIEIWYQAQLWLSENFPDEFN